MRQDQASWQIGYKDALDGCPFNAVGLDYLSYAAGRVEGEAARLRRNDGSTAQ